MSENLVSQLIIDGDGNLDLPSNVDHPNCSKRRPPTITAKSIAIQKDSEIITAPKNKFPRPIRNLAPLLDYYNGDDGYELEYFSEKHFPLQKASSVSGPPQKLVELVPGRSVTKIELDPEVHCSSDGQKFMFIKPNPIIGNRKSFGATLRRLEPHRHQNGRHKFGQFQSISKDNDRVLSLRRLSRYVGCRKKGDQHNSNFTIPLVLTES